MDDIEWQSSEKPGPCDHSPNYAYTKPKVKSYVIPKLKKRNFVKKDKLGPGYFYEGICQAEQWTMKRSCSVKINKTKKLNPIFWESESKIGVPGVGTYKHTEAFDKHVAKKGRLASIYHYRHRRFLTDVVAASVKVPGVGAYNIGPPPDFYTRGSEQSRPRRRVRNAPDDNKP